jgi:hypothetical protein
MAPEIPTGSGNPYDYHWSNYQDPIGIVGQDFTLTMLFTNDTTVFEVEGLGKFTVRHQETLPSSQSYFRAIGTRSTLGQGPCTVYYDDVYIYLP